MKRIGFLMEIYTFRGTGGCLYDYAFYNEKLLHNKSIIISPKEYEKTPINQELNKRFSVFERLYYDDWDSEKMDEICINNKIDAVYIIKYGKKDKYILTKTPTFIHCVFTTSEPHGTIYAGVSDSVSKKVFPVINHMVSLFSTTDSYRRELNIPQDAIVFGRTGGNDTFNISFVVDVILKILETSPNVYFLFAVRPKIMEKVNHPRIIFFEPFINPKVKRKFINTCDAMIDACSLGQSFGLSILEFSYCGKPVLTWNGGSLHQQHLANLRDKAMLYSSEDDLLSLLISFDKWKNNKDWRINHFTPEFVMNQFKNIFIDKLN
jgi:hypothetical protein